MSGCKFKIRYGLGGGFGGCGEWEDCDAETEEEAEDIAYEAACQVYEQYDGMHGLRDVTQIMEDGDAENEDEAKDIWREERDSWLDYEVYVKVKSNSR